MKAKPFTVKCKEEGRGKAHVTKFATLEEAAQYIKDRWQGVEYKDGPDGFHTDYSTYTLHGFEFKDIGKTIWEDNYPVEFAFNIDKKPEPPKGCQDDSCDANHCPKCGGHKLDWYANGVCSACQIEEDFKTAKAQEPLPF